MSSRLTTDYNSRDERDRVWCLGVNRPGPERERFSGHLSDGQRVTLSDGEIEVEAVLSLDAARGFWLADPDWTTVHEHAADRGDPSMGENRHDVAFAYSNVR